uniref:Uncharacterized protein n=1 Tax=Glossina morsitans morsitans TaxID=37546 RepID=A0A1B0FJG0_GLOMM
MWFINVVMSTLHLNVQAKTKESIPIHPKPYIILNHSHTQDQLSAIIVVRYSMAFIIKV